MRQAGKRIAMTRVDCEKLDAYLAGELTGDHRTHFAAHLEQCTTCREAVDEQQWIDGLLCSAQGTQLECAPTRVFESVQSRLVRRRIFTVACGLAAASVAIVVIWNAARNPEIMPQLTLEANNVAIIDTVHVPLARPMATFVSTNDAIAVPLESPAANVTVVQVFPTTETERHRLLRLAMPNLRTETDGG
jgi:anti-sigma factor RsiW